ncbi:PH domain-containing protein [uncultured Microbacterium sp.]|uniref:PH domain-containing protein n=1 Tax=uncultured Microbacterium sp. TaxID=191216 RepID=UPI00263A1863|nr:PH domain-containing protein [uncultured Microbacterium sp.]
MSAEDSSRRIVRPVTGTVWLVVVAVVVVILLADIVLRGGWAMAARFAPWMLAVIWIMWVFFDRPRVILEADAVEVRNPLLATRIPWSAIEDITLRWQVSFHLAGGSDVRAWATTARRPHRSGAAQPVDRELEIMRERLESARKAGEADAASLVRVWAWPEIISGSALILWCAVSPFFG